MGQEDADGGTLSWRAVDLVDAAQMGNTLAHRLQAQVAGERGGGIKAHAVIAHFQQQAALRALHSQLDIVGTRMFDRVVQRLLHDAVEFLFHLEREVG